MARSLFVLDERRVDEKDGNTYTIDSFMSEYSAEDGLAKWNAASKLDSKAEEKAVTELVKLLKSAAANLQSDDQTILDVVQKLVTVILKDPENRSAAACITPLCRSIKTQVPGFVAQLKEGMLNGTTQAIRRSSAVGFAAIVKGLGLRSIKSLGIMEYLHSLVTDSSNSNARQSAVFAYEALFRLFGYPFEPYVAVLVPRVVALFNDQQMQVRTTALKFAELIFANISHFAVGRLLPVLLSAAEDKNWRSKSGATVCLGAMAQCAPRALSKVLPSVVPRLMGLVSDSNPEVTRDAARALQAISEVLVNPEIVNVKTELLAALTDPNSHTKAAIASLMKTSYVHPIDPASLSLLMPILHWGLRDRSADTKRAAVQVVGSACNLVKDDRDLFPYLQELLPELKALVLDSIPDTRLFASKAIGMLVRRFGEEKTPGLIQWLMTKMENENNQIERHGAALCLAEVLYILGINRYKSLLPELRVKLNSPLAGVREGFMGFLLHLPVKFPEELPPFIPELNKIVLKGLIDPAQPVQALALDAGIQLMQVYFERAEGLLLPSIEEAMHDTRFKEVSIKLLGYLLARMAGVYDLQLEPDEMQSQDQAVNKVSKHDAKKIVECIGQERRDQLLALLILHRSDLERDVANMAGRVLRSVVENLGQVQEEIFESIMEITLESLEDPHRMRMAARCLGNFASKMLDRVMPVIMPMALDYDTPTLQREGMLAAMREVVANGHKDKLTAHTADFVSVLGAGLCHPEKQVRKAAVELHDELRTVFGDKVVDEVVKDLVREVTEGSESALDSLDTLSCTKNSPVYKFLANYIKDHPVQGELVKELEAVIEKAGKMQPAPVKPKPKLNAKKSNLDKKFDKATKKGMSREKK